MRDPFVVIGGDAAGLSAASKVKREAPDRAVVVFEKGSWVSFAHCGMPYYVKGEVDDVTDLLSLRPDDIEDRGIDLRRQHEVIDVDPDGATVTVDGPDGKLVQPYGDLLVGTGARAIDAPFPNLRRLDGAFTLHQMDAAVAIRAFLSPPSEFDDATLDVPYVDEAAVRPFVDRTPPTAAAIVGGGYVGVEMAEALAAWEVDTTLYQRGPRILPAFGGAVADVVQKHLESHGVAVETDAPVERLVGEDRLTGVVADGSTHAVDLAVVGVGVRPNAELLADCAELGESGAVVTDDYGRTSCDHVYAAGDCAESTHAVTGERTWVPLGLTANRAGRAVGQTVAGDPTPVGKIAGTAVVKAFDLGAGRTGLVDETAASEAGFDPVSVTVDASSRSGYYPGAAETTVTLVADRESERLLGGTTVGTDRAAKRIDTVATALQSGLTVDEVERLDLAYAPPFSPVWDPILVAAKVLNAELDD